MTDILVFHTNILNYKEPVNSIYGGEDIYFFLNTDQGDCSGFCFHDPHNK